MELDNKKSLAQAAFGKPLDKSFGGAPLITSVTSTNSKEQVLKQQYEQAPALKDPKISHFNKQDTPPPIEWFSHKFMKPCPFSDLEGYIFEDKTDKTTWKIYHCGLTAVNSLNYMSDSNIVNPSIVFMAIRPNATMDDIEKDDRFFTNPENTRCFIRKTSGEFESLTKSQLNDLKPKYSRLKDVLNRKNIESVDGSHLKRIACEPTPLFLDRTQVSKTVQQFDAFLQQTLPKMTSAEVRPITIADDFDEQPTGKDTAALMKAAEAAMKKESKVVGSPAKVSGTPNKESSKKKDKEEKNSKDDKESKKQDKKKSKKDKEKDKKSKGKESKNKDKDKKKKKSKKEDSDNDNENDDHTSEISSESEGDDSSAESSDSESESDSVSSPSEASDSDSKSKKKKKDSKDSKGAKKANGKKPKKDKKTPKSKKGEKKSKEESESESEKETPKKSKEADEEQPEQATETQTQQQAANNDTDFDLTAVYDNMKMSEEANAKNNNKKNVSGKKRKAGKSAEAEGSGADSSAGEENSKKDEVEKTSKKKGKRQRAWPKTDQQAYIKELTKASFEEKAKAIKKGEKLLDPLDCSSEERVRKIVNWAIFNAHFGDPQIAKSVPNPFARIPHRLDWASGYTLPEEEDIALVDFLSIEYFCMRRIKNHPRHDNDGADTPKPASTIKSF